MQLKTNAKPLKYWQAPMKSEMVVHLHWMQFILAKIEEDTEERDWHNPQLTLSLGKELIY